MPEFTTIVVGNQRTVHQIAPVRDPRQRAVVAAIVQADDFAFACGNPFIAVVGGYTGPFNFLYYTTDGVLHMVRVAKTGKILTHRTARSSRPVVREGVC